MPRCCRVHRLRMCCPYSKSDSSRQRVRGDDSAQAHHHFVCRLRAGGHCSVSQLSRRCLLHPIVVGSAPRRCWLSAGCVYAIGSCFHTHQRFPAAERDLQVNCHAEPSTNPLKCKQQSNNRIISHPPIGFQSYYFIVILVRVPLCSMSSSPPPDPPSKINPRFNPLNLKDNYLKREPKPSAKAWFGGAATVTLGISAIAFAGRSIARVGREKRFISKERLNPPVLSTCYLLQRLIHGSVHPTLP